MVSQYLFAILGNTTSLRQSNIPGNSSLNLPPEMQWVYAILKGSRLLGKAPIRRTSRRQPSLLKGASQKIIDFSTFVSGTFLPKKVAKPFSSKAFSNFQQALDKYFDSRPFLF